MTHRQLKLNIQEHIYSENILIFLLILKLNLFQNFLDAQFYIIYEWRN
jgi:hypothetical protein